jgi:hypothetical protein
MSGTGTRETRAMGYEVKIQRVDRGATKSFYVNLPAALAEAAGIVKGEAWEWSIEDLNTFVFQRKEPRKKLRRKEQQPLS